MTLRSLARHESQQVVAGRLKTTNDPKIELYKLIALGLDAKQIAGTTIPNPECLVDLKHLGKSLEHVLQTSFENTPPKRIDQANREAKVGAMLRVRLGRMAFAPDPLLDRLRDGARTASQITCSVLRTYHKEIVESGEPPTRSGIEKGARLLFPLAMLHIKSLNNPELFTFWCDDKGEKGDVINPRFTKYDALNGLRIRKSDLRSEEREYLDKLNRGRENSLEPRVGCPVTLVEGYLQEVWRIASVAALNAGIIVVGKMPELSP